MALIHNLGFPRIGAKRELKFAQEAFWKGQQSSDELLSQAKNIRMANWQSQKNLNWVPVGDFSLYDQVLDMSVTLGNLPQRVYESQGSELDYYFRAARGRSTNDSACHGVHAGEMTKWFDTNYHYIVPELSTQTQFSLNPERLLSQLAEAKQAGIPFKPVLIGPLTYLWLSKAQGDLNRLTFLEKLLPHYLNLFNQLTQAGAEWVQIDEPILVTELSEAWQHAFQTAYHTIKASNVKLLLTTYFGNFKENLSWVSRLPVHGFHLDAISNHDEALKLAHTLSSHQILSVGVIDGRNVWKTDLYATLSWLEPLANTLGDRLWLAPSCSLLHVPVDLDSEQHLDPEIRNWLAFAQQKLEELQILEQAINQGRHSVSYELASNQNALLNRKNSQRVHQPKIKAAVKAITSQDGQRQNNYTQRSTYQQEKFNLPLYPTTTIGSFPQTQNIRKARQAYKQNEISHQEYTNLMKHEIKHAIQVQEELGLDVLVHGEAERNDMVEYFGEQLQGYVFSQLGWVQSYGSRCVKPPILFGDVHRPKAMTVEWSQYAQSLTHKPMKGMLTGPVTMLNWSFVRDDQPRQETCMQLALAIRQEVLDLEAAGIQMIQIDEAALREGLPLRQSEWQSYLQWAIEAFRISANGVKDETQIHTHMCYSKFNDIIHAITHMDADVITIETSRSDMQLLNVFQEFEYPNQIGPGVYDIHSPNIPSTQQIMTLITQAAKRIPAKRLWINPDCGLKTRQWEEVILALKNMMAAANQLRGNVKH